MAKSTAHNYFDVAVTNQIANVSEDQRISIHPTVPNKFPLRLTVMGLMVFCGAFWGLVGFAILG
jgi:hypothetical protein